MDVASIDSIIEKKYDGVDVKKGSDYLQKIVQLPFKIPEWKAQDTSSSIGLKDISKEGLKSKTHCISE
jgi:KAP family P-loop domain